VESTGDPPDKLFVVASGAVKARPELVLNHFIRESIVLSHLETTTLSQREVPVEILEALQVLVWSAVKHLDVRVLLVPVVHHSIKRFKVNRGRGEGVVAAKGEVSVVILLLAQLFVDVPLEMQHLLVGVEVLGLLREVDRVVVVHIKGETLRETVVAVFLSDD